MLNLDKMKPYWECACRINTSFHNFNNFKPSFYIDEDELALGCPNGNVTVYSTHLKNMRTYDRDNLMRNIFTFGDPVYE